MGETLPPQEATCEDDVRGRGRFLPDHVESKGEPAASFSEAKGDHAVKDFFASEQEIPLGQRQTLRRIAAHQFAIDGHFVRLGIDVEPW
jgi:hypothetical protein